MGYRVRRPRPDPSRSVGSPVSPSRALDVVHGAMPLDERRNQRRNWRDGHAEPHRYPGHGDALTLSMPSRAGPVGTSAYAGIGVAGRPGDTGSGEVDDGALAAPRWASRG